MYFFRCLYYIYIYINILICRTYNGRVLRLGMGACRALRYWRDRKKRWRWAAVACAPRCRSWTSSPPRKRTTWSKSWTTGASAPSTTSPPPYRQPVRPYRRTCIRPPPGRISTGEFIVLIIVY